jgi:enamine deaminase RidA (YjgF/YER057c/UK114 family)
MAVRQTNDQQRSNLERRDNRIKELEVEVSIQKETLTEQIDKMHLKISDMEKDHHEKMTNYEKDNALLTQKNEFSMNKINELEKSLSTTLKTTEEKMNRLKEEKEAEMKESIERIKE